MTDPETHKAQEDWAESMGVRFIDVWFYQRRTNSWHCEPQVDDHDTFLETTTMSMERFGARQALWDDGEKWNVLDRVTGDTKRYPSRAAAEMVVIHVR